MKKLMIFFDIFIFVFSIQVSIICSAATPASLKPQSSSNQAAIDPADVEVIQNLDMLQNWDIVSPNGPDLNTGVNHAK
jgi:hypothetical protein